MQFHNIQCALIANDYNLPLAIISVRENRGSLTITQTASQARTDTASVIVKLEGEKIVKQKINTMVEYNGLKEYLAEFYINSEYVKEWKI